MDREEAERRLDAALGPSFAGKHPDRLTAIRALMDAHKPVPMPEDEKWEAVEGVYLNNLYAGRPGGLKAALRKAVELGLHKQFEDKNG